MEEEQQKDVVEQPSGLKRVWRKFRSQYNLKLMKDPLAASIALASCLTITSALNMLVSTHRQNAAEEKMGGTPFCIIRIGIKTPDAEHSATDIGTPPTSSFVC